MDLVVSRCALSAQLLGVQRVSAAGAVSSRGRKGVCIARVADYHSSARRFILPGRFDVTYLSIPRIQPERKSQTTQTSRAAVAAAP